GKPGLYALTVPTGGGKTVASLAFALEHAKQNKQTRVIYVIPYTSIIEQNAAVFAEILGRENVLEHHSNVKYDRETDEERTRKELSAENWDAPVVVTTNVRFFEGLFGSRTSVCRKLHNVANSVLIFDEAQMLPVPFLAPCVRAIEELVRNFGCTAVLCTATQPSLGKLLTLPVREIVGDATALYQFFRRTTFRDIGPQTDEELAARLRAHEQALCIVNNRRQARNLYGLLKCDGAFHLSTRMTPAHRSEVLARIRARLKNGETCRVVSTSLVEAGVDLDFPAVFRGRAGLDAIIQAAGRCNREGRRKAEESVVYIFSAPEYKTPRELERAAAAYETAASKHPDDIASPDAIHAYFEQRFYIEGDEALDSHGVLRQIAAGYKNGASFPFKDISRDFKLIDEETRSIIIPRGEDAAELLRRLRDGERSRALFREVGRHSVPLREWEFADLVKLGAVTQYDEQVLAIVDGYYDEETGLKFDVQGGLPYFA
ncbi:MAG: CRISPR-associated helicase Cas3', partial [Oscillospiraceae bacterium]|nr:CRISPR-associated helicase Cas3' [Oscillospiraceae bacterium]